MNPILNQVGTIFIPVSNVEKSRDWYCDLLGLPSDGEILFGHLYVIPMNGVDIVLDSKNFSTDNILNTPLFHFNTNNIEQSYTYMKNKGIELTTEIEHGHWFNFKDLDGNYLMICTC
ncbi:MAG TPA: VOC family protein [Fusibacter sp.]|nr:VOC family protein [Fusibacter sp.]